MNINIIDIITKVVAEQTLTVDQMNTVEWERVGLLHDTVELEGTDKLGNEFTAIGWISSPRFQWEELPITYIEDVRCERGDELLVHSTWRNYEEFLKQTKDYYGKHRAALQGVQT